MPHVHHRYRGYGVVFYRVWCSFLSDRIFAYPARILIKYAYLLVSNRILSVFTVSCRILNDTERIVRILNVFLKDTVYLKRIWGCTTRYA